MNRVLWSENPPSSSSLSLSSSSVTGSLLDTNHHHTNAISYKRRRRTVADNEHHNNKTASETWHSQPPESTTCITTTTTTTSTTTTTPLDRFTFRPIDKIDGGRVKELHEDWFPVVYKDSFYEELTENHLHGNPLFTRVAIYNNAQQHHDEESTFPANMPHNPNPFSHQLDDGDDDDLEAQRRTNHHNPLIAATTKTNSTTSSNHHRNDHDLHSTDQGDIIAGCVVGSFMSVTRISPSLRDLLVNDPLTHYRIFYIMTLGTVDQFRGAGLGTQLVKQCMDQVQEDPSCGLLYLHVMTTNHGAIRLYEKLGFYRVQEIPDYYDIDGEKFPCFLYAKYFHGNQGHRHLMKVIRRCVYRLVSTIWNHVSQLSSGHSPQALLDPDDWRSSSMADESDPGL